MLVRPLGVLQAAPSLPRALARLAHTPRARLGLIYRLVCRSGNAPRNSSSCAARDVQQGVNVRPADERRPQELDRDGLRPLGEALLLDRLVTGGILGTELRLLECDAQGELAGPVGGEVDMHA